MLIPEARNFVGKTCAVTYRDRRGDQHTMSMQVQDVTFVPMYGGCLVGDVDDVWLERVSNISVLG